MIVGLTGGIGCGKTTVAKIFQQLGCPIFDSDKSAKESNEEVKDQLIEIIGTEAYLTDGSLNRKYVSDLMFSDIKIRMKVNELYLPVIERKFKEFVASVKGTYPFIVYETALLFEANHQKIVDKIITVDAAETLRISRILLRNPELTTTDIYKRINAQLPQDFKIQNSDFVIHNNSLENLNPQVQEIFTQLTQNVQTK